MINTLMTFYAVLAALIVWDAIKSGYRYSRDRRLEQLRRRLKDSSEQLQDTINATQSQNKKGI